jgi:hypothetical protein
MKTSSIVAAAVLTVVSFNHAIAGGWIASARPNVVPLTHMIGVPINRAPASFGPINRFGPFNHFFFANRFGTGFGPFGQFGFQRPFGAFGFQRPAGVATIVSLGSVAPSLPDPPGGGESAPRIIWAPSYVTVVSAEPPCGDARLAGGPKIIEIGESSPSRAEKLPVVIYGAHGGCPS